MSSDAKIHAAHCSHYECVYADPGCPVQEVSLPGGRAEQALGKLQESLDEIYGSVSTEYRVRGTTDGWVYALPKLLPKFLDSKRDTRECAEWHRRQIAGPDPEDQQFFEIVCRPVGPWEVVG